MTYYKVSGWTALRALVIVGFVLGLVGVTLFPTGGLLLGAAVMLFTVTGVILATSAFGWCLRNQERIDAALSKHLVICIGKEETK